MVFSNVLFLFVFLPAVIAAYFIVPSKFVFLRNLVLLGFSLIFYFLGGHQYITLILASILMNFLFGLVLENRKSKLLVGLFVGANLLAIGVFKYMGLILSTMKAFGINVPDVSVELPIGISFFTFQAISYLVDVYRSDAAAQKNPFNFGLYISMFPQLIAGPIVRYQEVAKEMKERKIRIEDFGKGVERLVFGFAKKILIANQMGLVADQVFNRPSPVSASLAWLGAIAYGFQIYFDFSGYSDMAIGLGKIFGYNFPENFNHPYTCSSITDFWRKWHMTLSTWFRDYVYIPLGGSRTGKARHAFNLMAVWLLTGLWHGANWTFAVWGAYFGALLIGEKFVIRPERLGKVSGMAYRILCLA
ncbi:MAG: MBOAT family protein, partial [Clostridiales bacterium]|nr:MBOAT family protein [Clostridiales bacterium]